MLSKESNDGENSQKKKMAMASSVIPWRGHMKVVKRRLILDSSRNIRVNREEKEDALACRTSMSSP